MKLIVVAMSALLSISSARAQQWDAPCTSLPGGTGIVNDPSGCPNYFSCVAGTAFEMYCPSGFYFDHARQVCDLPNYVDCTRCPPVGVLGIDDPSSCEAWILCVNGHEVPQKCGPGTLFNPELRACDLSENVRCALHTCSNLEGGIGLAPAPDDCSAYFYCFEYEKLVRGRCANGLAFDSITNRCVRLGTETCFNAQVARPANAPLAPVSNRY